MGIRALAKYPMAEQFLGMVDYYRCPHYRDSWGGAFNGQAFRQQIFLELINAINISAIVETGSFRGTTTEYLHKRSQLPVYTVEIHPRNYGYVKIRFLFSKGIFPVKNDSRSFLRQLLANTTLKEKTIFFYLDAHWDEDLPLTDECQIIFENCHQAVVMVDDFKVPGDEGYGFDDYGHGRELSLKLLAPLIEKLGLAAFFPSKGSDFESGSKRGCVVLAKSCQIICALRSMRTLAQSA